MQKGILTAVLFLCCGLVHANTNAEVRQMLDESFTVSMSEKVSLHTALMFIGETTGLDFRLKLPCSGIAQSVKLVLSAQLTVKDALDYLAKQAGFTWKVNGGYIEITFTSGKDIEQPTTRIYYVGDIQFLINAPSSTPVNAHAIANYIETMVTPNGWDEAEIVVFNDDKLVIQQTEKKHLLIANLLRDIRSKNCMQFRVSVSNILSDGKKEILETKTGLCGQEITFVVPERQEALFLEISPCLTNVLAEIANKPFRLHLQPGKTVKVKGIAGKKNGSDVLELTLSIDGKETETRLFCGALLHKEEQ